MYHSPQICLALPIRLCPSSVLAGASNQTCVLSLALFWQSTLAAESQCTVPPFKWHQQCLPSTDFPGPQCFMASAAPSKPMAYNELANDFETQRSSPSGCTKCTRGASGTTGWDNCASGMSYNHTLVRWTSSKYPFLNWFTNLLSVLMG